MKVHSDLPLSFLLDIDAQRRYISHYKEYKEKSRKMYVTISQAIINSCLETQHDVIVDKMTFDPDLLAFYYDVAKRYDATVYEIILWAPKEVVMKRAEERGWREDGLLTPEKCELFWNKINELKDTRPQANVINTEKMSLDETYREVTKIIQ